ncbi:MAG: glucose-6-phosphate isomerase, partial [Planctomycetes bacterium]|nr:glucose-6-phosphate isomerase [Planctomycetota bacterium]
MKPLDPIAYDYSGLIAPKDAPRFVRQTGLVDADLKWLAPRLAGARQEVLDNLAMYERGIQPPEDKQPLDAAFFDLPERLLDEDRPLLDRIVAAGDRMAKEVDRVVILGIGGSYMGARALFESCCHPYHNEFSRQRRGGRPRIYFAGNNVDNDSIQGLLDLVEGTDDWGIVVISKSGTTLETAVAFRLFLDSLRKACGGDDEKLRSRVIAITGETGGLHELAESIGCRDIFPIPDGVGGRYSVLSAVGLLPAAVMGLDVSHLLEGAAAINGRFRTAPPL